MRTTCGVLILAFTTACGGRTATPAGAPASGSAEAEAAARITIQQYDELERRIDESYSALQQQLAGRQSKEAADTALQLAETFGEVERFWAQNGRQDAVKWAQQARTGATQAAAAAGTGDVAKANQAATSMQGVCTQCHGAYRENDTAGGYRIKPAALTR